MTNVKSVKFMLFYILFHSCLYRVCNDLLLWEPLAPVPGAATPKSSKLLGSDALQGLNGMSLLEPSRYMACKSTFATDGECHRSLRSLVYSGVSECNILTANLLLNALFVLLLLCC